MFGFFGTPESALEGSSPGLTSGSTRIFGLYLDTKPIYSTSCIGSSFFDTDNVNAIKADTESLTGSTTPVTYTGRPKTTLLGVTENTVNFTVAVVGGGAVVSSNFIVINTSANTRRFRYTSSSILSPTTRKTKQISDFYFTRYANIGNITGSAFDANSNNGVGTFNLFCDRFPYLEGVHFEATQYSTINLRLGNRVRFVRLANFPLATAITGKLPDSVTSFIFAQNGSTFTNTTSFNNLISEAVNLTGLFFSVSTGSAFPSLGFSTRGLTGTLNIAHLTLLKDFVISNNTGLTAINLPTGKSDWQIFMVSNGGSGITTAAILEAIASPSLKLFAFSDNSGLSSWGRNITNSDIGNNVVAFYLATTRFTGNVTLTTNRPNLRDFGLSNGTNHSTNFVTCATIDITGLTNGRSINLAGVFCQDLQLPVNTVCTELYLQDNKLDIVTNPNIVTQINAITALTILQLSDTTTVGQSSTNGLGNNPDLSGLLNLIELYISSCKIVGSLTIYNGNKLTSLYISNNPLLTSIVNFTSHTSLSAFICSGSTLLATNITNAFTALSDVNITNNTAMTSVDFSGKSAASTLGVTINSTSITSITLPTGTFGLIKSSGSGLSITSNSLLTTLNNISSVRFGGTGATANQFNCNNNALLNITFPFGAMSNPPRIITIQNNGMSTANCDATIASIGNNATKWDGYTAAKTLTMNGTNAALSGIYQFSATPTTGNEWRYYLTVTKGWTILAN